MLKLNSKIVGKEYEERLENIKDIEDYKKVAMISCKNI
jgi:hypothetical protein